MDSTMAPASDPIRNGTWSLVFKIPPIDCLRRSLEIISGKDSIPRSNFAAQ